MAQMTKSAQLFGDNFGWSRYFENFTNIGVICSNLIATNFNYILINS